MIWNLFASNKKKESFWGPLRTNIDKKAFKSFDFYDVKRTIYEVIGTIPISKDDFICESNPIKKIEFSVESAANFISKNNFKWNPENQGK